VDIPVFFPRTMCVLGLVRRSIVGRLAFIASTLLLASGAQAAAQPGASPAIAVPAYRQANHVAVLTIEGPIDTITLTSLERRIKKATADGADAIVLKLNTPGGDLFATLEICNLLKDRNITPANIVSWVSPQAYSAGTIISLACREIVVTPGGTFGDAAPIQWDPLRGLQPMPPTERAKREAPLLAEIIDSARRNHYDEKLVQGFVKLGDGLWLLENVETGERVFVDLAEYQQVFGDNPPQVIAPPMSPLASSLPPGQIVTPRFDDTSRRKNGHRGDEAATSERDFEMSQSLPPTRVPLTTSDRNHWRLVHQVVDNSTLLTVKSDEAVFYGLAKGIVANDADLQAYFGAQTIRNYDQSWSESLVRFLINPLVRGILILIFLICLFVELAVPGFGVFGAGAAGALLLLIGAPMLAGMAQWWDILLIVAGVVLVLAELFIIPGFGLTGMVGAACLLIGLVGTFVSGDLSTSQGQNQLMTGVMTTLTSVFASGILMWLISRQMPTLPIFNRLILQTELKNDAALAMAPTGLLEAMAPSSAEVRAGDVGVAFTDLRPSGRASFNNRLLDVKSAGEYIEKGSPVRVISVGRFVIEVEEFDA
jgi:membrane-bound serine protease (ClpP class)